MNYRIFSILSICLLIAVLLSMTFSIVRSQIKLVKTRDVFGSITVTIGNTLTQKSWDSGYDPVLETTRKFPKTKVKDHQILDGWDNPIVIEIEDAGTAFNVKIISPGKDGVLGTNDDIQSTGSVSKE